MAKGGGGSHNSSWRKNNSSYEVNGDDLQTMKDKHLIEGDVTEEMYKGSLFARLDLLTLDSEVRDALEKAGIKPKDNVVLDFMGKEIRYRGSGGFWISRRLKVNEDGELEVKHDLFAVPTSLQGSGLSKALYRTFMTQYKKMGVQRIKMHANIDVGGYAWARYGFSGKRMQIKGIIMDQFDKGVISAQQRDDAIKTINKYADENGRIRMNHLSDKPYGKKLLLGTSWDGELELSDSKQVKRFNDYLNGKIRSKNDGEKKK